MNIASLLRRRAVVVKEDWLCGTTERLMRNYAGTLPPAQLLCDLIITCWQNASLQETSLPCLPTGFHQFQRQMLQGPLCLQWEPSPKRMLILELTDGYQVIQAMEYQSIPCFSTSTLPGSKVCLHGNIPCRRGMLLLTAENVEFIGGSVENLVKENRQDKVLARALCIGCPEEEDAALDDFATADDLHDDDFEDLGNDLNDDDLALVDLEQYN